MVILLDIFLLVTIINITSAYNPFEGFLALEEEDVCFEIVNDNGCNTQLSKVFSPPYKAININAMNTKLFLFTATNPQKAEPLHNCGGKLPAGTTFDPTAETIFVVHGWIDGVCRTAWKREIKEQLLIRGNYNVVLVDWTWGNTIDFVDAGYNADVVGEDIAFVIMNIIDQTNMKNADKFHLVGHSFGSYVMNAAAKYLAMTDPKLKPRRVTLLDPAAAPLKGGNPYLMIKAEYTKFMDVIHSDAGSCFPNNFGFSAPVGHADFYPNGGTFQVACYPYLIPSFEKGDLIYALGSLLFPAVCSHFHAIQYFKVSINHPQGFYIGVKCNSYEEFMQGDCKRCCKKDLSQCAYMGMDAEKSFPYWGKPRKNRTYYLNLGLECPYNEDYEFSIYHNC